MDSDYIVSHLNKLAKCMYSTGEPFAKYSEKREVYIFGVIKPFGKVIKNIVDKSVAIYLICGNYAGTNSD
jgi:hypothetical protein